jgi:hypothetical protein
MSNRPSGNTIGGCPRRGGEESGGGKSGETGGGMEVVRIHVEVEVGKLEEQKVVKTQV